MGGLAVGYYFPTQAQKATNEPGQASGPEASDRLDSIEAKAPGLNPNAFIHVGPDGIVTIVCQRSEMGQGIRSSLPVLIADELGADMARVTIRQADGDTVYGDQNTDGSNSVRVHLRRHAASGRNRTHDARRGGGEAVERGAGRVHREGPQGHAYSDRTRIRVRRTGA